MEVTMKASEKDKSMDNYKSSYLYKYIQQLINCCEAISQILMMLIISLYLT
jgi:hypothetical protein